MKSNSSERASRSKRRVPCEYSKIFQVYIRLVYETEETGECVDTARIKRENFKRITRVLKMPY